MATAYRYLFDDEDLAWQEWSFFNTRTLETINDIIRISNVNDENDCSNVFRPYGICGVHKHGGAGSSEWGSWSTLIKPSSPTFVLDSENLNKCHTCGIFYHMAKENWNDGGDNVYEYTKFMGLNDPQSQDLDWNYVTAQRVNRNEIWNPLPIRPIPFSPSEQTRVSDGMYKNAEGWSLDSFPDEFYIYLKPWHAGGNSFYLWAYKLFQYGCYLYMDGGYIGGSWEAPGAGEEFKMSLSPVKIKIYYLNSIVNSLSHRVYKTDSGDDFSLYGKGFYIPEATLNKYGGPAQAYADSTEYIHFIGLQGQGTYTVYHVDFSIKDNHQITIPENKMPALPKGTYYIQIQKRNENTGIDYRNYAGDYRCLDSGRIFPGDRLILGVDINIPETEDPIILTKWEFEHLGVSIFKYVAPIDTRANEVFYDGEILNMSSLKKSINERTGTPAISDMSVQLANHHKEWSKIAAQYDIKNKFVSIYHAAKGGFELDKTLCATMIIDDYEVIGTKFNVFLKDITRKYFDKKLPEFLILEDDYPNADENALGKGQPEILGHNTLTTGDAPGACEALKVDGTAKRYMCSRGSLKEIEEVYSSAALQYEGTDYEVVYAEGGKTFLDFYVDQEKKKITFNCKGYIYAAWMSDEGYVQCPVYIALFALAFLIKIPVELIDLDSFNDLHDYFVDKGAEKTGKLVISDTESIDEVLKQYLFTFGIKLFVGNEGKLKVNMKRVEDYQSSYYIFEQLDCKSAPILTPNLRKAANHLRWRGDFIPASRLYKKAGSLSHDQSIKDFGAIIEPSSSPLLFPWTTSQAVINYRISEELSKNAYGEKTLKIKVPFHHGTTLEILDSFRFQSLFTPTASGEGEAGRYYYITAFTFNWQSNFVDIEAIDLQWLLRQLMIIGKYADLVRNWEDATEIQRMFAYIGRCAEGTFEDGTPNKKLGTC
jgi:hypothetical protein